MKEKLSLNLEFDVAELCKAWGCILATYNTETHISLHQCFLIKKKNRTLDSLDFGPCYIFSSVLTTTQISFKFVFCLFNIDFFVVSFGRFCWNRTSSTAP